MQDKLAVCYTKSNSAVSIAYIKASCYSLVMDVRQARESNFTALLKLYKNNRVFAEAAGIAPAHVSQMKTHTRGIGDEVARRIEKKLRLPHGWMDQAHGETPPPVVAEEPSPYQPLSPPEVREWLALVNGLTPRQRETARDKLRTMVAENQEVIAYVVNMQANDINKEIPGGGGRPPLPLMTDVSVMMADLTMPANGGTDRRVRNDGRFPGEKERRH